MKELKNFKEARKAMIEKINQSKDGDDICLIAGEFFCSAGEPLDIITGLTFNSVRVFADTYKTTLDEANHRLIKIMINNYLENTKEDPVIFFKRLMG